MPASAAAPSGPARDFKQVNWNLILTLNVKVRAGFWVTELSQRARTPARLFAPKWDKGFSARERGLLKEGWSV